MELPFEVQDQQKLGAERAKLNKNIQDLNSKSEDNEVLKNIMVDLLKLQFSLEDNLLLMKQLNCFPTENEKKDVIVNAGRLQIALISSVNQLGFQWMRRCPLFTNLETGEQTSSISDITPPVLDQTLSCLEIKIDVDEIDNLMEAGEENFPEKLCLLDSKTRFTETAVLPEFKDVNEFNPGTLVNPSNLIVKEEEMDTKGCGNPCESCEYVARTEQALRRHQIKKHKNVKTIQRCEPCKLSYKSLKGLRRHQREIHGRYKYSCKFCAYVGSREKFKKHLRISHSDKNPDVLECGVLVESQGDFKCKKKTRRPCKKCEFIGDSAANLRRHMQSSHYTEFKCEQCDYIGKSESLLKAHIKNCHSGVNFICDQCDYVGKSKSLLMSHIMGRHDSKTLMCDKCEYVTNRPQLLQKHIDFKHEGVNFPCDQCNYVGGSLAHVKIHKTTQHEPPSFFCNQCDYSAKLAKFLKAHIESAHEKIRYPCNLCDHASTSASNLRQHKRRVHKMKPEETFD